SQTLESMVTINDVVHIPLLRPLVCFDKEEIVKVAREIGTYETSILPYEDCCTIFDPKNPVTKPKINKAEHYEGRFDWQSFVNECLEKDEIVICRPKSEREDYL
ncbi:MAG: tRNA 4-thiouridine(8) synthase ThiI, partial [Erysipelotrichaceae bacterium]|nr:tRNA 4-thiouridine(8) synthase ThiI [Erysipelotrichaceae bacterium]